MEDRTNLKNSYEFSNLQLSLYIHQIPFSFLLSVVVSIQLLLSVVHPYIMCKNTYKLSHRIETSLTAFCLIENREIFHCRKILTGIYHVDLTRDDK